jgi:hypothetical protein
MRIGNRRNYLGIVLGLALLDAALCNQIAHGDFVQLVVVDISDNNIGLAEFAVYAQFDDPFDEVIGILKPSILSSTGFFHNTIEGTGASALPFTNALNAESDHRDADSFVTIGLPTGDGNETILSPLFDVDAFLVGNSINGGWFNGNPLNDAGMAGPSGLVLIAVFAPLNDVLGDAGVVSGSLQVGYVDASGEVVAVGSYFITPAPGVLGLLALAGLLGRSRRRRS